MTDLKLPETPKLDAVDMTARANGNCERLSDVEFLLLEQLLRYPEHPVSRVSLTTVIVDQLASRATAQSAAMPAPPMSDRMVDKLMLGVMQKTNALFRAYPLVRRIGRDSWIYTEVAPRRRKS